MDSGDSTCVPNEMANDFLILFFILVKRIRYDIMFLDPED